MRKTIIFFVLISFLTVSFTGCFGSFALTRKVYEFNRSMDEKFVQSLLMWAMMIIPIYELATLVDVAILNLIEFWTNDNPLAMSDTDIEQKYITHEEKTYEVITTKNRFDISEVNNPENSFSLVFNDSESSWYLHSNEHVIKITEEKENGLQLFGFDGTLLATY